MRKTLVSGIVAVLLGFVVPARAQEPATTSTVVQTQTTTFPVIEPCTGNVGTMTLDYLIVFHSTELSQQDFNPRSFSIFTGNFFLDLTDPPLPDYSGNWVQRIGLSHNTTGTENINLLGLGTDGSHLRFQFLAHITVVSGNAVIVDFEKLRCG